MIIRRPIFETATFQPGELEAIAGVTAERVRLWRKRGHIHNSLEKGPAGFDAGQVAELACLRILSDQGMDPARTYGWSIGFGGHALSFALAERKAWPSDEDFAAWQRHVGDAERERFAVIFKAPAGIRFTNDLDGLYRRYGPDGSTAVATVLDLYTIGTQLRVNADKPLMRVREWIEIRVTDGDA